MRILAIIITYNRLCLIKECIAAVKNQTYADFDILVIDNQSTDGTTEYLNTLEKEKILFSLKPEKNIGGAGGFYTGIKEALRLGYSHVWLMDDDTVPDNDALENLHKADQLLKYYGFLVSLPLWKDGYICKMNMPLLGPLKQEKGHFLRAGLLPVQKATFVSIFIKTDVIKEVGLPIKEFFIWGDDQEYTERISKKYRSYLVLPSVAKHKTINNLGSDISSDSSERIARYYYAYRNELYISKRKGVLSICFYLTRFLYSFFKIILFSQGEKLDRIKWMLRGLFDGIFFHPKIEFFDNKDTL